VTKPPMPEISRDPERQQAYLLLRFYCTNDINHEVKVHSEEAER